MSQSPVEYPLAPPLLGEHTRQVLMEIIGLPGAEIDALLAAEVIGRTEMKIKFSNESNSHL